MTLPDYKNKWLVLSAVSAGIFLATIDGGIVNLALPTLVRSFAEPIGRVRWAVLAYLITVAALLIPFGRLGDRVGKKWVYGAGFILFTATSALCGTAHSIENLVAYRILQAVGAAMMVSLGMGIATEAFPPQERGRALGIAGSIVSAGIIAGPAVGGMLLQNFEWRSIFYVNVPIGIVGVLMVARFIPAGRPQKHAHKPSTRDLFRIPGFVTALATALVTFALSAGTNFLWPFYLQDVLGRPSGEAGFLMSVIPASIAIASPLAGNLTDKWGTARINRIGLCILVVGYSLLLLLRPTGGVVAFALTMLPLGIGAGFFQASNNSFLMGSAPKPLVGFVSSLVAFSRSLGFALGVTLFSTIWSLGVERLPPSADANDRMTILHLNFGVAAAIALLGALPSLTLLRRKLDKAQSAS